MLVDSHCHLDFPDLADDLDQVLQRMQDNGIAHALCISVTLENWPNVQAIAASHPQISASVGVHPDEARAREPSVQVGRLWQRQK